MNDHDPWMRPEEVFELLVKQIMTGFLDRIPEILAHLTVTPDVQWCTGGRTVIAECKRWHAVPLPAMTVAWYGSVTTTFPELPADHLPEQARKQVISWQLFLIVLITLFVIAAPAVVLSWNLPSQLQLALLTYDGIFATYVASYTFSALDKRK